MTDRYNALIVVLDQNIRDDDAQATIAAIGQIKHVLSVKGSVADVSDAVATERVRREMERRLWAALASKEPR